MFKRYGKSLVLFLAGIIIGGCIDAATPRPNHIHLTVTPYGGVTVSPEDKDVLDWKSLTQGQNVTANFDPPAPCYNGNNVATCQYNAGAVKYYSQYNCQGATCDPAIGPPGGSFVFAGNTLLTFFQKVATVFNRLFFGIDRVLHFVPTPVSVSGIPIAAGVNPSVAAAPASEAVARPALTPYADVECSVGKTTVANSPGYANPGDKIVWLSQNYLFTLKMPANFCANSAKPADSSQFCTLMNNVPANSYSYTATANGCSESDPVAIKVPVPPAPAPK